jgi:hypothetical protein
MGGPATAASGLRRSRRASLPGVLLVVVVVVIVVVSRVPGVVGIGQVVAR